jgi:hypothetical protein
MAALARLGTFRAFYLSNSMPLAITFAIILIATASLRTKVLVVASAFLLLQSAWVPSCARTG